MYLLCFPEKCFLSLIRSHHEYLQNRKAPFNGRELRRVLEHNRKHFCRKKRLFAEIPFSQHAIILNTVNFTSIVVEDASDLPHRFSSWSFFQPSQNCSATIGEFAWRTDFQGKCTLFYMIFRRDCEALHEIVRTFRKCSFNTRIFLLLSPHLLEKENFFFRPKILHEFPTFVLIQLTSINFISSTL